MSSIIWPLWLLFFFLFAVVIKPATVRSGFARVQAPNVLDIMGILRVHYKAPRIGAVVRRSVGPVVSSAKWFFPLFCFPFFFPSTNPQIEKYNTHVYICQMCKTTKRHIKLQYLFCYLPTFIYMCMYICMRVYMYIPTYMCLCLFKWTYVFCVFPNAVLALTT